MKCMYRLENPIQNYAWGSRSAMVELFGIPNPDGRPLAELWMGAHRKAPSLLVDGTSRIPLNDFIAAYPEKVLGPASVSAFGPELPFLFKVLSAGEPLSIQAHPNLEQAARGFDEEERRGIPLDDPARNYRDRNHKPEIICALTPFQALRGFRPPREIALNFRDCRDARLSEAALAVAYENTADALRSFFMTIMEMSRERVIDAAVVLSKSTLGESDGGFGWLGKLVSLYPGDPGVFAPLYLNLVRLAPGQAMFLPAGELHAYLEGTGMELMANSDNVLRGGLTAKHVDVPELLSVLTFGSGTPEILSPAYYPENSGNNVRIGTYPSESKEFSLSAVSIECPAGERVTIERPPAAEIMICVDGNVELEDSEGKTFDLKPGDSVFLAACLERYTLSGLGKLYAGTVGSENMG